MKALLALFTLFFISHRAFGESVDLRLNVNFNTNEIGFDQEGEELLMQLYDVAISFPKAQIFIGGHTDSTGPRDYNMMLSLQRANSVAIFLKSKGISEERLSTKGFGEHAPIASNKTAEGRYQNRRVVASIMGITKEESEELKQKVAALPPETKALELMNESEPVEVYKKSIEEPEVKTEPFWPYYITGYLGYRPNWSSDYFGDDGGNEGGLFDSISLGLEFGVRLSKNWFLDAYTFYLPTSISEGGSGINFDEFTIEDTFSYENKIYGLRLRRSLLRWSNQELSAVGGYLINDLGAFEPLGGGRVTFGNFRHHALSVGARYNADLNTKWTFFSDLAYLLPLSVSRVSEFTDTSWYRGVLGLRRTLRTRLRLALDYQILIKKSVFTYETNDRSTPQFRIQTILLGLEYNF